MQMKTFMGAGLAGALLLGTAGMAWAGTMTQTESFGPASSFSGETLSFGGYTGAGTLTGVSITVTESISGGMKVTNTGTSPTSGTIGVTDFSSVSSTDFSTVNLTNPSGIVTESLTKSGTPDDTSGFVTLTGTVHDTFNPANLTPFESAWTATASDSSALNVNFNPDTINLGVATGGEVVVSAVYTFTGGAVSVAEPFSVAMLASGLLSLAMVRRRRRS
jgi:hypothetical protein